jgi:(p)ppGpp synthase/HD superfamily hydrolase
LGPVVFVQTEFQIIDRHTEQHNELGEASHSAYKERQKQSVMHRLKVGNDAQRAKPEEPKPEDPKKEDE